MTLPVPLSVRISTSRSDRHVTADLHELSFRSVVPGGFASARMSLNRPLVRQADELGYYARVYVYDTRSGNTVWEGRLEDPGRSVGAGGEIWDVAAVGPSAHAQDRSVPLIYLDTSLERWRRYGALSSPRSTSTIEELTDNDPALRHLFSIGAGVVTNDAAIWVYRAIWESGQKLAKVFCGVDNGATTADWENRIGTGVGTGGQTARDTTTWSTTRALMYAALGGGNAISNGDNVATLRIVRTGGSVTLGAAGDAWGLFDTVQVLGMRYDADGSEVTSGYGTTSFTNLFVVQVVNDLLGRLLDQYDGANASVEAAYEVIDQLAYPDGVTAAKVLEDMMLLNPNYYWAAWESNSAGLHRFEWRSWPTDVRYEADVVDGYQSTGSAGELYNAVAVRYRDRWGFIRTVRRASTVPVLTDAGLTREAFSDLGDEIASNTNAIQVGDQFLTEHATPPNAGTLTIARPIHDHHGHKMIMPWEIRPGELIRVQGIMANPNTLNVTTRDGVTVFRVTAVDFDAASASATLELDSGPAAAVTTRPLAGRPSTARTLAVMDRNRITRRR